jgi:hypothetical protein
MNGFGGCVIYHLRKTTHGEIALLSFKMIISVSENSRFELIPFNQIFSKA